MLKTQFVLLYLCKFKKKKKPFFYYSYKKKIETKFGTTKKKDLGVKLGIICYENNITMNASSWF